MKRNTITPSALAKEAISSFRTGSAAILEACNIVARAYASLDEGEWTESQFASFFDQLSKAGIGTGSGQFYPRKGRVTEFNSKVAGTYYEMKSVGECEVFKSPDFKNASRITSYSTLYRLRVLYNVFIDRETGSPAKNKERAVKQVMDLVGRGIELTRDDVDTAIKKAKASREKKSLKPVTEQPAVSEIAAKEKKATIQELVEQEAQYDLVVMTPREEFLEEAVMSSPATLAERIPYQELRADKSKVVLIGAGNQGAGLQKLADLSPDVVYRYCVRANPDASTVIDLAKEKLVFSSHPLDCSSKPQKGESVDDFVNRLVAGAAQPTARKLRIFSNQAEEDWDTASS